MNTKQETINVMLKKETEEMKSELLEAKKELSEVKEVNIAL